MLAHGEVKSAVVFVWGSDLLTFTSVRCMRSFDTDRCGEMMIPITHFPALGSCAVACSVLCLPASEIRIAPRIVDSVSWVDDQA